MAHSGGNGKAPRHRQFRSAAAASAARGDEAGFTLIEVVISLALFALISMAGLALVDAIVRVDERTAGRLERLGQLHRAMYVLSRDLEQSSVGSVEEIADGVRFERQPGGLDEAGRAISYSLRGGRLFRSVGEKAAGTSQLLVSGVSSARWSFFLVGRGWENDIPLDERSQPLRPAAIAVEIMLDGAAAPSGSLRRVVELPLPSLPGQPL
ncbi:MAG: prepilin-type N-terminal cleavage/methylation domain-containing protein [Pseudomonadota bacterium]|nr:prepilin-type N-terminal cleavage/methylation domain-containing protein [Pseudomonadota bacterium]